MIYAVALIIFVWLVVLTALILKTKAHYINLVSRTQKHSIDEILDELLSRDRQTKEELEIIKKELKTEIKKSLLHFQKIGLIRFSPFERGGGDKSFVISLLNYENSGIVINFIHTRDGLRVYSKKVVNGKGGDFELSEEEKRAIEKSS